MPEIIDGYSTQQKVSLVPNTESDINASITTEASDGWIVVSMILSGTDVIILFTRTTVVS